MLAELDAVVFDFDGVINRNYDAQGFLWARTLHRDHGVEPAALAKALFVGPRFEAILEGRVDLKSVLAELLPALGYAGEVDGFLTYWFEKDLSLCPDLLALLAELQAAGVRCAVGTNNEPHRASFLWERCLKGRVAAIYASGHLGVAKPQPAFFRRVQQELGVEDPSRLLFIDDAPRNVEAARAEGWRGQEYGDFSRLTLGDPAELRRLLGL